MRKFPVVVLLLCAFLARPALSQLPPGCENTLPVPDPYVFILLDISGSMNHAVPCTQAEYDAGQCAYVCSGSQCHTPMQGDHPGSKWFQTRQALYNILSGIDDVRFGFATFSEQNAQRVKAKHWLYQATTAGPAIPAPGGGPFPAVGSQEVFGTSWPCTAGAGDGCSNTVPADLNDAWEVTRVKRLPKGGDAFNQTVDVFVRSAGTYKVRYEPVAGGALGGPIQTMVTTSRCTNPTCTTTTLIGTQTVSWEPVGDFLSWENAASTASRTQPYSFFNQTTASDTTATTICSINNGGWEPNADDVPDTFMAGGIPYNLKQPTDASDPRGPIFTKGDVIPLDWLDRHKEDVLARLAPNLAFDPFAVPNFRTAAYFQDHAAPGEGFLRLDDESVRPIVPYGVSALGWSIRDFYDWFTECGNKCLDPTNWEEIAAVEDPGWGCRRLHLLVITDSQEECNTFNPCADVASLNAKSNLSTSVIGIGQSELSGGNLLRCLADNGGGLFAVPKTRQQIEQALIEFFDWVRQP
jgi:hypothetical protein